MQASRVEGRPREKQAMVLTQGQVEAAPQKSRSSPPVECGVRDVSEEGHCRCVEQEGAFASIN